MEIVAMPQLGETVTEGTITRWLKAVGDHVAADEALFEVSTDKVDTEVPVLTGGFLRAVLVPEGDTVPIGAPLAVMTATADEPFEAIDDTTRLPPRWDDRPGGDPLERPNGAAPAGRAPARVLSPAVRRLLDDHGVAPGDVVGSGRDGRVTRADVLAAAANRPRERTVGREAAATVATTPTAAATPTPTPTPPAVTRGPDDDVVAFTKARRSTAEHMMRSQRTSAHTLVATQVDYHAVDAARRASRLSYLPFVARAVLDALRNFPHLNASVGDDELIVHRRIHLGVAVDVDGEALVVPVVHDADLLRLDALAESVAELAGRARAKRLNAGDLTGGTFTITNVGRYGTVVTTPVINQPQVAILSTDGVRMTPVAVATPDGWAVVVHPIGNLSLSFDHRAVDGAYAAAFLADVRDRLETHAWSTELTAGPGHASAVGR